MSVFLDEPFFEETEGECSLGCGSGLGDDVDSEFLVLDMFPDLIQVAGRESVSGKDDFEFIFRI